MIEVRNLTKSFGPHLAVDDVSFTVNDGEIVGFLGPNGAGKSTTMNMITGYLSATEGDIFINGLNILEEPERSKKQIGYLPEMPPVYGDMRVDEYLKFVAALKKVKSSQVKPMIEKIKKSVHITEMSNRLIKNLSKGYRQRVGLAQAMIGDPEALILDEPTVGLDPKQILEMRDVIRNLGKKHTIILSSHILQEITAVCERVIIINNGRIIVSDNLEHLENQYADGTKMIVGIKGSRERIMDAVGSINLFESVKFETSEEKGIEQVIITGKEDRDIREDLFYALAKNELPIVSMKKFGLTLEEIFIQVTTGQEGEINVSNL